jgi:hypothetical protein
MADFWNKEQEVASFVKNGRGEEIKVKKVEKSGKQYIDIRTFYPDRIGDLQPGKGISIPAELTDEILKAIQQCKEITL